MRAARPLRLLVAAAAAAGTAPAAAAPTLPITETLDWGDYDAQLVGGVSRFGSGQGNTLDVLPRLRIGVPGAFDISVAAPYRFDMEADRSAMRATLELGGGYQLLAGDDMEARAYAYTYLNPSSARRDVGSGSHNLGVGVDFQADDWLVPGDFFLRGSLERRDRRTDLDREWPSYTLTNRLMVEGAITLQTDADIEPYLGLRGTQGVGSGRSSDEQSLSLRPGLRMTLTERNELEVLGQVDALQRDVEPEQAIFLTWTFRERTTEREPAGTRQRIDALETRVGALDRQMTDLERQARPEPEPRDPRQPERGIVVLNHSGIPELTELVSDTIADLDEHEVAEAREEPDVPRRHRTEIHFREGHAQQAREIARALPGNQMLEPAEELPDGAEIVVYVGFDLE